LPRTRNLSSNEKALLARVVAEVEARGASNLAAQVNEATVIGGLPTLVDLDVPRTLPSASIQDGPLPVRALVDAANGQVAGELLVWVRGGYLSGLEFAWYTNDAPTAMPPLERVRIE
jgi:hypothetical protein